MIQISEPESRERYPGTVRRAGGLFFSFFRALDQSPISPLLDGDLRSGTVVKIHATGVLLICI